MEDPCFHRVGRRALSTEQVFWGLCDPTQLAGSQGRAGWLRFKTAILLSCNRVSGPRPNLVQ
jgi:hypothetical protein